MPVFIMAIARVSKSNYQFHYLKDAVLVIYGLVSRIIPLIPPTLLLGFPQMRPQSLMNPPHLLPTLSDLILGQHQWTHPHLSEAPLV